MRLSLSPWSIAGVPSSQALPGFLITAQFLVTASICYQPFIGSSCMATKPKKKGEKKEITHRTAE